jgi:putative peptidoglycan lipid II flippase
VWLLMLPGVIAAGITQTNIFINTAFALYLQPGSVTALSSAFHLWQLPVALFGVAVGMVVLPTVSRMTLTSGDSGNEISAHLAKALRFVALFAVPSAVFLSIWGTEIVSVFYQRGRFDAAAADFTGSVLAAYSFGLLAYAGMKVLQPVFLALEKPWAPAGLALVAFCISVGCNYTFVHILGLPAMYLALTTSIVTTLNFLFYFLYIRHLLGGMSLHILMPGLLRIMGAGVVLALVCWSAGHFFFADFTSWSFFSRFGALAVGGSVCGALYVGACLLFRVPELQAVTGRFLKRR